MAKRPSPQKPAPGRTSQTQSLPVPSYSSHATSNGFSQTGSYGGHGFGQPQGSPYPSSTSSRDGPTITFKQSPFYSIESQIGITHPCPAMTQHRSSVNVPLRLTETPALQRCVDDPAYRVMVFCAAEGQGPQDIAFPHQSELKVNGGDIKANLRGLKNKPGSTRPVDLTSSLRLKSSYNNHIEFTWALTSKVRLSLGR